MILQHCIALNLLASQILDSKRRFVILDSTFVIRNQLRFGYGHPYLKMCCTGARPRKGVLPSDVKKRFFFALVFFTSFFCFYVFFLFFLFIPS